MTQGVWQKAICSLPIPLFNVHPGVRLYKVILPQTAVKAAACTGLPGRLISAKEMFLL